MKLQNTQRVEKKDNYTTGFIGTDNDYFWIFPNLLDFSLPIIRIKNLQTIKMLNNLLHTTSDFKNIFNQVCYKCRGQIFIEISKYGPFWQCTKCRKIQERKVTLKEATEYARKMGVECESCGGMVLAKKGKNGFFLGCENYPTCMWTKNF